MTQANGQLAVGPDRSEGQVMVKGSDIVTQDGESPLVARIAKLGLIETGDADAAAYAIAGRIIEAATVEDVLADQDLDDAEDFLDQPLQLEHVDFLRGDYPEGLGIYAVLSGHVVHDGKEFRFTCGGTNVVTQLARLRELDGLPVHVALVKAPRPTKNGYWPLWLKAA